MKYCETFQQQQSIADIVSPPRSPLSAVTFAPGSPPGHDRLFRSFDCIFVHRSAHSCSPLSSVAHRYSFSGQFALRRIQCISLFNSFAVANRVQRCQPILFSEGVSPALPSLPQLPRLPGNINMFVLATVTRTVALFHSSQVQMSFGTPPQSGFSRFLHLQTCTSSLSPSLLVNLTVDTGSYSLLIGSSSLPELVNTSSYDPSQSSTSSAQPDSWQCRNSPQSLVLLHAPSSCKLLSLPFPFRIVIEQPVFLLSCALLFASLSARRRLLQTNA